ncbi:MAG: YveK family protein [Anaerolineales bacterium]
MNLLEYGKILLRQGWIIALAIVIVAGAAFIFSRTQTVLYTASQEVLIEPARNDFGLQETLRIQMRSYLEYLDTNLRAQDVIERLELDMTPGELRSKATFNSDATTQIIQIDIEMEDPVVAAEVAHTWGEQLVEFRNQRNSDLRREDRIEATLLDFPGAGQTQPNTRTNVIAGAILGLLLGGATVFVLEYLEANLLRTRNDLERWVELPVLATIPAETRGD